MALSVSVASASAAEWHVGGSPLVGSSTLTTATPEAFAIDSLGLVIECEGVGMKGGKITAHAGGSIEHLVFSECRFTNPGCLLSSRTIESKPLTIEATLGTKSPEDTLTLKPTSGTTFFEFKLTGTECFSVGKHLITGTLKESLPTGRDEVAAQELTSRGQTNELRWDGTEAEVYDSAQLKLTTGQAWSFH